MFQQAQLQFIDQLPRVKDFSKLSILIYDKTLLKSKKLRTWIESFPFRYGVEGGEKLKQVKSFEKHALKILAIANQLQSKEISLIALGGGSVGDFVGFLASVFKRGVALVQIPSTWLAAIDSAHGGKTALNLGGFKNQIGTFYPAEKTIICKALLLTQPVERAVDAEGEIRKTILLAGGPLWSRTRNHARYDERKIFSLLPTLIKFKYSVVAKDPYEKKGIRFILNFGHTLGHAFESIYGLSHGHAVNFGLRFAIEFSKDFGILNEIEYRKILSSAFASGLPHPIELLDMLQNKKRLQSALLQDKKMAKDGQIRFVFLEKIGRAKVERVPLERIFQFVERLRASYTK